MVPAIIGIAHSLKLRVVAEGVETEIKRTFAQHWIMVVIRFRDICIWLTCRQNQFLNVIKAGPEVAVGYTISSRSY